MPRHVLRYSVDLILLLSVLTLVLTGLLMSFVVPPGSGGDSVWSMTRHDWGDVHFWTATVMLGAIALHVLLNWSWVCTMSLRLIRPGAQAPSPRARHIAGVGFVTAIVLLIAAFVITASVSIERGAGGHRRGDGFSGGVQHRGGG